MWQHYEYLKQKVINITKDFTSETFFHLFVLELFDIYFFVNHDRPSHDMLSWASLCFVTVLITFRFYILLFSFMFILWVKCVNHLIEKKDYLTLTGTIEPKLWVLSTIILNHNVKFSPPLNYHRRYYHA